MTAGVREQHTDKAAAVRAAKLPFRQAKALIIGLVQLFLHSLGYCNKIIEIDPENYLAWLLKGKTAGWQSSLGNIRFNEAITKDI